MLTRQLKSMEHLKSPKPPYNCFSFKSLSEKVRQLDLPYFCSVARSYNSYGRHKCGELKVTLEATIKTLEGGLGGLNIEDFIIRDERKVPKDSTAASLDPQ